MKETIKAEKLKELLKGFFEEIFDQETVKEFRESFDTALGLSYSLKYDAKQLYTFSIDDEAFKQAFVDDPDADANIKEVLHFMANEVHYGIFNFCGCGWPTAIDYLIRKLLNAFDEPTGHEANFGLEEPILLNTDKLAKEFNVDLYNFEDADLDKPEGVYPWMVVFIIYQLDGLGLTEHGTNIRGSYLTDKGIIARRILNEYAKADDWDDEEDNEQ